jgi:energy-coupling factor transporter ATP-binding protein EcfA2
MINLILGHKGSGKTKKLIELVNAAVEKSNGNVVCIEKERLLTYDVNYRARLVETDHYGVSGYDAFYGFLSGIVAGDHDITDILIDATLKIGGRDYEALANFLENVAELSKISEQDITFTISCDECELPERIFTFCEKI